MYFDQMLDYPVQAINWAAVGQQNPDIAAARARTSLALVGGAHEAGALLRGTPAEVAAEAAAAIRAGGATTFLLAPGCGVAITTPEANLFALRRAVDQIPALDV